MLRGSRPWLLGVAALLLVSVAIVARPLRADTPGQVQFQARLTDPTGKPLPDGTVAKVTFIMFKEAAAVTSLWGEIHTNVPISRGVISVQLGNGAQSLALNGTVTPGANPLTAALFDGTTRYLQISVNSDPPLSPTIPLVSVPYALTAGSINGKTESQLAIPVGTIVDWLPPTPGAAPPAGWMICDGSTVNDAASPYNGTHVPDLRGRVTRGITTNTASLGPGSLPDVAGNDSVSFDVSHSHNVNPHTHSIPAHTHSFTQSPYGANQTSEPVETNDMSSVITGVSHLSNGLDHHVHSLPNTDSGGGGTTGSTGGSTDTAGLGRTLDIRPSYVGLLKIIRIK